MPHAHDEFAELFISPFGEQVWTQRGVRIRGPFSLKARFVALADEELQDPPVDHAPLRRRLFGHD